MKHRTSLHRIAVVLLALGMVCGLASPAAATYCVKNGDTPIICVNP